MKKQTSRLLTVLFTTMVFSTLAMFAPLSAIPIYGQQGLISAEVTKA